MEEKDQLSRLRALFRSFDTKRSGRLGRGDFSSLCTELKVSPPEAETIFRRLDTDRDGAITFEDFVMGFRGARGLQVPQGTCDSVGERPRSPHSPEKEEHHEAETISPAWEDFQHRLGDEAHYIPRAQDKAAMQLSELEEEMDHRIQAVENRIKKETKRKAEEVLNDLKRQHESEVAELQVTIKKLKKLEEQSKSLSLKEDVAALRKRMHDLTMRANNTSPGSTISRNSPKLNRCHSPYDRSPRSSFLDEDYDSLAACDPMQRMNCEVDSLPESCLDSGLSTLRDSNEYDSEVEYRPQRIVHRSRFAHESFGGDASDTDVPEIRDEESYAPDTNSTLLDWRPSQPVSRSSSGASSRKCISALPAQAESTGRVNKYPNTEKAHKIVLAGDAAVGKSSFLMRLCKNEFRGNTSATLGVDFQMKTLVVDGEPTLLQLWDTAGQERFRSIAKSYFRRADGVLLLYDVTCEKSFLNVREWVDMIEDATHDSIPIMMVGNKADLRQIMSEQGHKCVPTSYGEKLSMTYGALFCETSAKEGSNIVEAVLHLAREVRKRSDNADDTGSVTNLAGATTKKTIQMKNCCTV
ncbi:hypothetical protein FKM82_000643 [Ascaphus truei]